MSLAQDIREAALSMDPLPAEVSDVLYEWDTGEDAHGPTFFVHWRTFALLVACALDGGPND